MSGAWTPSTISSTCLRPNMCDVLTVGAISIIQIFEIDITRRCYERDNHGKFTAVLDLVNGAGLTEGGSSVEARPVPCGPRAIPKRADVKFLEFASGGRARVRLRTGGLPVVPTCAATRSASSPAREQAKGHKRRIKTATARDERERQHPDREERQARAGAFRAIGRNATNRVRPNLSFRWAEKPR